MRKGDLKAFADFLMDEAVKYARAIGKDEIDTWFETFERTTLEDFRTAWIEYKRSERGGDFFPKIPQLQKLLRTTGKDAVARDWRCAAEVGHAHCNYPGAISFGQLGGGPFYCSAHYRLLAGELTTHGVKDASLQIIERSQTYTPPKTYDELYRLNDARRAGQKRVVELQKKRLAADVLPEPKLPERDDGPPVDDIPPLESEYAEEVRP